MIRSIVFDLGKVLVDFHPKQAMEQLGFSNQAMEAFLQNVFPGAWEACDEKPYTLLEVKDILNRANPGYEKEVDWLWSGENVQALTSVYEYSNRWLKDLKERGYGIYVLSNFGKLAFEINSKLYDFLQYVDGRVMSYEESMIKPNPALYETLFTRYGIVPEEAVFIDDRVKNVDGARQCGMHGIVFTNYEQASAELEQLLVG